METRRRGASGMWNRVAAGILEGATETVKTVKTEAVKTEDSEDSKERQNRTDRQKKVQTGVIVGSVSVAVDSEAWAQGALTKIAAERWGVVCRLEYDM